MSDITHYCFHCGSPLHATNIFNRLREKCPVCGWVHYQQLKVGAAAMIERNQQVLLLRRANQPWQGCWNLPAGYVEADEDPRDAAARETLEECGLVVQAGKLLGAHYFTDDPRGNGLLLVYACEWVSGSIHVDREEAQEFSWFAAHDLPAELTGAGHAVALRQWALRQGAG